jgi:hypothetical protein
MFEPLSSTIEKISVEGLRHGPGSKKESFLEFDDRQKTATFLATKYHETHETPFPVHRGNAGRGNLLLAGDTLYGLVGRSTNSGSSASVFSIGTNGRNFTTVYNFSATANDQLASPNGGLLLCNSTLF